MSRGKSYERECIKSIRDAGGIAYRNTDAMTGKGSHSVRSLPDMFAFWDTGSVNLIECKVVKGTSLPFNRLADHQQDELEHFDKYAPNFHGGLLILYYNGELGKKRISRSFHIPISSWIATRHNIERKSLTMHHASIIGTEIPWQPGYGWVIPTTLRGGNT